MGYAAALLASLAYLISLRSAQHLSRPAPYPSWALNRSEPVSNSGPMRRMLNENKTGIRAANDLLDHFDTVGRAVARATDTSDYARTARREVCNATNAVSLTAINVKTRTLGFGQFSSSCITELPTGDHAKIWKALDDMYSVLAASSARILSATASKRKASQSRAIAKGKPKVSWKRTYQHAAFTYRGPFTTCKMRHVAAFRVRGKWGVLASLTSDEPEFLLGSRKRQYLEEMVARGRGGKGSKLGNLPINVNATGGEGPRERATTSMSTWGGMPATSIFLEVASLEENPAIRAALFSGERWRQQAIDSVTASNIAIMVLSLLLALVPIALFADVSAIVAFAYALVTDVGSCLPLAIKGIELIQLSTIQHRATRTWAYGLEKEDALGAAEAWVARCQSRNHLYVTGVVFLCVAVAAMAAGIGLEVYTRQKLQRRRVYDNVLQADGRNKALQQMWAREDRCEQCACYASRMDIGMQDEVMPLGSTGIWSSNLRKARDIPLEWGTRRQK